MRNLACACAFAFLLAASHHAPALAGFVYSDGDFDRSNWTSTILGSGASGSIVTQLTGGNPDAHSVITTTEGSGRWVVVADVWGGVSFDPGAFGGITTIDYLEDYRNSAADGNFGQGQSHGPVLWQNGKFYTTNAATIFTGIVEDWTTLSLPGLQASDFAEVIPSALTATGAFDFSSNPDFSASGTPIQFGYYRANGNINTSITGRLDNWSVTVNTVPEPSGIALFACGLSVIGFARKRARA